MPDLKGSCLMELQTQITTLDQKVEGLHELIERLSVQVAYLISDANARAEHNTDLVHSASTSPPIREASILDTLLDHQDVLMDYGVGSSRTSSEETALSPEAQVQRLTAQLTAAYNRIAALEEQLLAHSNMPHRSR